MQAMNALISHVPPLRRGKLGAPPPLPAPATAASRSDAWDDMSTTSSGPRVCSAFGPNPNYLSARQQRAAGRQAMAARSTAMMAAAGSRVALAPALRAVPRGALAQNTAVTQVRERRD